MSNFKLQEGKAPCPTFRRPWGGRCFSFCKCWGYSHCHYLQI